MSHKNSQDMSSGVSLKSEWKPFPIPKYATVKTIPESINFIGAFEDKISATLNNLYPEKHPALRCIDISIRTFFPAKTMRHLVFCPLFVPHSLVVDGLGVDILHHTSISLFFYCLFLEGGDWVVLPFLFF